MSKSSRHAAVGEIPGTARLYRCRRDRRERGGSCSRVGAAWVRRPRAHPAALDSLVARSVHDERTVCRVVGAATSVVLRSALPTSRSCTDWAASRPCASHVCWPGWRRSRRRVRPTGHDFCGSRGDRSRGPALAQKMAIPLVFSRSRRVVAVAPRPFASDANRMTRTDHAPSARVRWARLRQIVGPLLAAPADAGELKSRIGGARRASMAPSDDGRLDPLLVQDDRAWWYIASRRQGPSPRSRAGSTDTRARTPASAKPSPTPSPASIETIRDGASNSITTISSLSREDPRLGTIPRPSDSRPLHERAGAAARAQTPPPRAGQRRAVHSARDAFVRGRSRPRPLAPGLSPRLAARTHSVGTMANTSVARHSRRSLAPLLPSPVVSRRDRRGLVHGLSQAFQERALPRALHRQRSGHGRRGNRQKASSASASSITRPCRIHPSKTENRNRSGDRSKAGFCLHARGRARAHARSASPPPKPGSSRNTNARCIRKSGSRSTGICVAPASAANRPARRAPTRLAHRSLAQTAPKRRHCHRRWRSLRGPRRVPHLLQLRLRVARWDLTCVDLVDPPLRRSLGHASADRQGSQRRAHSARRRSRRYRRG